MAFVLPVYTPPDFTRSGLATAPVARFEAVSQAGVAPQGFYATTIFPTYVHLTPGLWALPEQSRMDCVIVKKDTGQIKEGSGGELDVVEARNLQIGDKVACGRDEDGKDGLYVHTTPFAVPGSSKDTAQGKEKFAFRTRMTRESSFSIDYDELYDLLSYEREKGYIVWVTGPAVVFDHDSREAFARLVSQGYVHALLAGNALATHDLEACVYKTALGQTLYSRKAAPLGHYNHLDLLNSIRAQGSIAAAINAGDITSGIMYALVKKNIPYVLAGSIRDDGPLPETITDASRAQNAMRKVMRQATTVITLATQLHAIAVGNMTPCYTVCTDKTVRPVYFYSVDMSEFVTTKLANRGSLSARSILTNAQDFVVTTERGLNNRCETARPGASPPT